MLGCSCLMAASLWITALAPAMSSTITFSPCRSLCIPTVTYCDCQQRGACFGLAWDLLVTIPFSNLDFASVAPELFLARFAPRPEFRSCPGCLTAWFSHWFLAVSILNLGRLHARTRSLRDLPWVPPILVGRMPLQTCSSKFGKTSFPGPI